MKEADKRARITVAYGGLVLLKEQLSKDPKHKSTRAHLFAIPKDEDKAPEIVKAVRSKDWQRDYLQRLVDGGILRRLMVGSQEMYEVLDPEEIDRLITDHDNWGLRLSKFLFPREAGIPNELADEDKPDDTDPGDLQIDRSGATDEVMIQMSERTIGTLNKILASTRDHVALTGEALLRVLEQNKEISAALEAMTPPGSTQAEKEFPGFVKNRFKELETRLDKLEENSNFGARTLARIEANLNALKSLLGIEENQTLTTRIDSVLDRRLNQARQSESIRGVLGELSARLNDLKAVEDLALKAIESIDQDEVAHER